MEKVKVKVKG